MRPTSHFLSPHPNSSLLLLLPPGVGDTASDLGSTKLELRTYHLPHLSNVFQNSVRIARAMTSSLDRKWKEFRGPDLNMK